MKYSPIKSIRTKNFMALGDIYVDMTKSPIVSLVGENESGKTSFIKSVAVCGANAFETEQREYIRTGTSGFGVVMELQDGTNVVRIKRKDVNIYEVNIPGKEKWSTSKIDRGYGTPKEVEDVMGFVTEPETKELLNVRTYENKCLFVLTKASENYKVMYNALKVDNITKAVKEGNSQANIAKRSISACEKSIETLEDNLRKLRIVDMEPAIRIKKRIQDELEQLELLERANSLIETNNRLASQLGSMNILNEKSEINEVEAMLLSSVYDILERNGQIIESANIYNEVNKLNNIEYTIEEQLSHVIELKENIDEREDQLGVYNNISNISEIPEDDIALFERVLNMINRNNELLNKRDVETVRLNEIDMNELGIMEELNRVYQLEHIINKCENVLGQLQQYELQCSNELKRIGARVVNCPNCGEELVVEDEESM